MYFDDNDKDFLFIFDFNYIWSRLIQLFFVLVLSWLFCRYSITIDNVSIDKSKNIYGIFILHCTEFLDIFSRGPVKDTTL
jgi:hypothetical protein